MFQSLSFRSVNGPLPLQHFVASRPSFSQSIPLHQSKEPASKSKGGKQQKDDDNDAPPPEFDMSKMQLKMRSCIDRANPALLDKVQVVMEKKGKGAVALSEIAQISTKDAHTLMVVLNDEDYTPFAEKSIRDAKLGLSPQKVDGSTLKVTVPKTSRNIIKSISQIAEKHRTQIRDLRATARVDLKKLKIKSTDEVKRIEDKDSKEHDVFMKDVDAAVEAKKKEVASH
ncbi:ribosome recycling factor [Rhizoclosmatium globosum]|uniref:Ribosome recycling factor n=1 Tax=Rhizoclosmatium globosum TaxID=329046 RepID=A0A1Y2CH59_9FUNG|nr:ribosome recycling factor [Rhizoclosmatium globosum]|eukprot:ORY46391.1 ribosome recycling factor [Rhizoclosmatium globosum]